MPIIQYHDSTLNPIHGDLERAAYESITYAINPWDKLGPIDYARVRRNQYWPLHFEKVILFAGFLRSKGIKFSTKVIENDVEMFYSNIDTINGEDGVGAMMNISKCELQYDDPDGVLYEQFLLET